MSTRYLLVINPVSGTESKAHIEGVAHELLDRDGLTLEVHHTTGPGDATAVAAEAAANGYAAVLAVGGDGTINEVGRALAGSDTVMGIIPAGSGNGLARHLGIPMDARMALEVIGRGHVEAVDYARVNGVPFFCTCGIGFDAAVSHRFAGKQRRGRLSYLSSVLEEFRSYHPEKYVIRIGDEVFAQEALLVAVANASQYGNNAYIAPHASINDGMLDVTVVQSGHPLQMARMGVELFTGYIDRDTTIRTIRTPRVTIERQSAGPAHVDGEPMTLDAVLRCEVRQHELKVFCNTPDPDFQPIVTPLRALLADFSITLSHLFQ